MTKKNKVAGILSVILLIVFIISLITMLVTGVVVLFMFIAVPVGGFFDGLLDGFRSDSDSDYTMGEFVEITMAFITATMFVVVSSRLMEVLRTISAGTPFEAENADRFKRIAKVIFFAELAKLAIVPVAFLWAVLFGVEYGDGGGLSIDLTNWLGAAVALVLAEVFREGARLQEEQEFTV